jgi:gliding motility-associated-like protein
MITGDITYTVTATTPAGCVGTGSIKIQAVKQADILVPGAFSPNGDGRNDLLRVHLIGMRSLSYFQVFNRWGQQVFASRNAADGWDGTLGGEAQPSGTYVWIAAGVDFRGNLLERRGTAILVR